eukprot:TRINITY_DN32694_c0_g1_i1.p1 TRINITY_DN32694_c0_g1~~TRINITY_DN32694_c0_g1_i1.p1  ORF type:complete len:122 (-),score=48.38 TRINITY_DN32694_c0_g1_i1:947-1288(-)
MGGGDVYQAWEGCLTISPSVVSLMEYWYFNPYIMGRVMASPLYNDMMDVPMAKDVSFFLVWATSPEHDMRKGMGLKALTMLSFLLVTSYYFKRHKWTVIKSRKIIYTPREKVV